MALVSITAARKARRRPAAGVGAPAVRILVHSINDDRCTGCDACVAVCPTNVLDLVENKSRVLRFQDCIQCEACMWACPTTALVMHPEGTEPPTYRMPDLDEFYQTRIPGQYLIGEVAGKPLVKNAANLGRAVVEHMLATGLRSLGNRRDAVDVAIVGSGPGGLSAALTCIQRGLSYVVLEKDSLVASTIARYPKGKLIMAEPYEVANLSLLPVFDSSKEETIPIWKELIERVGLQIRMNETVEHCQPTPGGLFEIRTNVGGYRAQRVVLATGLRGKPRTLGVQGENLPKVSSLLEDPDNHRGQTVCVVGGGDSALEAAIALADAGAKVILTYRGKSFSRAQPKNRQTVESYEAQRRIKIKYQSEVVAFTEDTVTLQMADGTQKRYPNQAAFVLIGADPPIDWLGTMGIHYVERQHMHALPPSDRLVSRFLGDRAMACPETAAGAAAVLFGEEIPAGAARRQVVAESRSRKWLRSASKVFTGSGKLDRPMPLSEFAQQARRHSGHGRRDKLDPRERTRVLRMLRDEGGRQADEDSKIYILDKGGRMSGDRAPASRQPYGSPPPAPRRAPPAPPTPSRAMPSVATQPDALPLFEDPVRTIPPTGRERVLGKEGAVHHAESSPKAAVIVGLARATERGPRTGSRRRKSPSPSARPAVVEAPTRQIGPEQSRRLFERFQAEREAEAAAQQGRRITPAPPAHDPTMDDRFPEDGPTRQVRLGP
ncbi:MAG TPA: NAD(P)-binding domain-containing protein, partial [Kofleriaceae bacterium]|nr:NAD(P)-binding domain-containing protein [Kofleriaceae bacterium]